MARKTKKQPQAKPANHLRLAVTDFGPIARAEIDLRPLTVFVGPSNTGKSYLAILIYALHKFWNGSQSRGFDLGYSVERDYLFEPSRTVIFDDASKDALWEWLKTERNQSAHEVRHPAQVPSEIISRFWESMAVSSARGINVMISRMFDAQIGDLRRHGSQSSTNILASREVLHSGIASSAAYKIAINKSTVSQGELSPSFSMEVDREYLNSVILSTLDPDVFTSEVDAKQDFDVSHVTERFGRMVARGIASSLLNPLTSNAYYLPADRTGIMHAHRVVVSSLIIGAVGGGLRRESPLESLSGVLVDFLERLIRPERTRGLSRREWGGRTIRVADDIEERLLSGVIHKDDTTTGYPRFFYQPEGWRSRIPLMRTSSMVSELAPIVLYLRYVVAPGDVLIIEEPEAHLHPAMQREFTRQIAAMIKDGLRVIITTHSEWVLEELANIVYSSEVSDLEAAPDEAKDPLALTDDEVGVWLFEPKNRPRGSVVSELKLDRETGSFDTGYDEVSRSLYNRFAGIANLIEWNRD